MLNSKRSSNSGQAMVEFLPAIMIFVMVMSAGLAYFRVMRAAALRQEAVRNMAFAKIDNSGTLTTVDTPDEGKSAASVGIAIEGRSVDAITSGNNAFIDSGVSCFRVVPSGTAQMALEVKYREGASAALPVVLTTFAVVCRN